MKIYILTHPLQGNYGGMLQAFALLTICSCEVNNTHAVLIDYHTHSIIENKKKASFWIKYLIRYLQYTFTKKSTNSFIPGISKVNLAEKFKKTISRYNKYATLKSIRNITRISEESLLNGVHIVGSDQVWRASDIRNVTKMGTFFLSYLTKNWRNKSISYAASFGTDEWEGTPEETEECGCLLREFKAVSVREHSGVKICKDVFGVDAVQMPDPTLLLYTEDYGKIINSEKTWLPNRKYVAAYVLDETAGKSKLLQESAESLNLQLQHLMPHADAKKRRDRFPFSVPQWLRLIRDCEYLITASFHGCVFAIIFNKPFVCLGNEGRGNSRFDTLMGTYGLEDRLITDATAEKVLKVFHTLIDWTRVNAIHDAEREHGINFQKKNLSD